VFDLEANQLAYIPLGTRHGLANIRSEPLRVIEVRSGSDLGEDDIVRFDDRYGRERTRGWGRGRLGSK
jgi:mannose-6-phosphate isomerase-like protein (cupin superfamily)